MMKSLLGSLKTETHVTRTFSPLWVSMKSLSTIEGCDL